MFCSLTTHFKQQTEALLFATGKFTGPVQPIILNMACAMIIKAGTIYSYEINQNTAAARKQP